MRYDDLTKKQKDALNRLYAGYGAIFVEEHLGFARFEIPQSQSEIPKIFGEVVAINFDKRTFDVEITTSVLELITHLLNKKSN